jgi:hypothetical protein
VLPKNHFCNVVDLAPEIKDKIPMCPSARKGKRKSKAIQAEVSRQFVSRYFNSNSIRHSK